MIRSIALASILATGLALPAVAGDAPANDAANADPAAFTATLNYAASANTARKILIGRGYTQVSDLTRGEDGRWTGTAMKDGKVVMVGVELPVAPPSATN
jgi:hypothetical protein